MNKLANYVTFIMLIFVSPKFGYTQGYFSKFYGDSFPVNNYVSGNPVEVPGIGHIFPLFEVNNSNNRGNLVLKKIDYQGNEILTKSYGDTTWNVNPKQSIRSSDSKIYVIGDKTDLVSYSSQVFVAHVTESLDTISFWKYSLGVKSVMSYDVVESFDKCLVIIGTSIAYNTSNNPLPSQIFLMKIDTTGNLIWQKKYGGIYSDMGLGVVALDDNSFIISGGYGSSNSSNTYVAGINSNGILTWQKQIPLPYDDGGNAIIQTRDNYFLIASEQIDNTTGLGKSYFSKIDSSGNLIWQKSLGGPYYSNVIDITQDSSGNIIGVGGNTNTFDNSQAGWLLKLSETGDSIRSAIVDANPGYSELFYRVSSVSDGGYIVSGQGCDPSLSTFDQQGWIIKADSLGCEIPCSLITTSETYATPLILTPNPTTGLVSLTFDNSLQKKNIIVFNSSGQHIIYVETANLKEDIDLSGQPDGLYFIKINSGASTKTYKIVVYR